MIRVSSNTRSPLQAGQARMARSSSSIMDDALPMLSVEEVEGPAEAFGERHRRRPAELAPREVVVEAAPPLLAGARRAVLGGDCEPGAPHQDPVQLVHGGLDARADVDGGGDARALEGAKVCR